LPYRPIDDLPLEKGGVRREDGGNEEVRTQCGASERCLGSGGEDGGSGLCVFAGGFGSGRGSKGLRGYPLVLQLPEVVYLQVDLISAGSEEKTHIAEDEECPSTGGGHVDVWRRREERVDSGKEIARDLFDRIGVVQALRRQL
jgi:hypothetical protein